MREAKVQLAPDDAPRAAVLLYRKHVITERYIDDLITIMEAQGSFPSLSTVWKRTWLCETC
jgi:magnesium chelatase subunit H